ncbi:hypothetical protein H2200_005236 [Cladophialophora chaetospira]|uniref:DNA mismatch repair protein S5 domain-containing protein n=1 Tax=Cladophialophora chaetospira TaxID=386627 RepID=A0AA38XC91_9EURO|nr:hypothetical protein H2200_005236 [Cladophialophora chaetospira]
MPIEPLPEITTRVLSSSLVLNDAKSVVKELVDNALDARATAINVEISANTLDVIQVKDNGTGIDVEDRQLLGRRGCTSKIRTTDDLARLGGTFLGFRGEALASIVELSQAVVVTTRVDGEVAGTAIKYAISGMISSSSTSHPVGTTIRVQDFLTRIPVRKQTALKTVTRTLDSIKSLLFAFAFARPEVRFSLKVLKGKNDKMNWTYAASSSPTVTEVATKIVGKEVASMCTPHTISSDSCDVDIGPDWSINALVISAAAADKPDISKVRNAMQYVSVDGRPVSMERHMMKQVAKSYKRHVQKGVLSAIGSSVSRPFLLMQIRCPSASYDVNVEPAKDEVLFLDGRADQLLSLVDCLLARAYPEANVRKGNSTANGTALPPQEDSSIFDKNMLRTESVHHHSAAAADGTEQDVESSDDIALRKESVRTPWTITAMNAIVKPKQTNANEVTTSLGMGTSAAPDSQMKDVSGGILPTRGRRRRRSLEQGGEHVLPSTLDTSPPISPRPGPPMRRWVKASTDADDEELAPGVPRLGNTPVLPPQTGLQTWLTPDDGLRGAVGNGNPSSSFSTTDSMPKLTTSAIRVPDLMPSESHTPPSSSQMGRSRKGGPKAFKVPYKYKSHGELTSGLPPTPPSSINDRHQQTLQKDLRGMPSSLEPEGDDPMSFHSGQHEVPRSSSELNDIMEFEHRKKAVIAQQRRLAVRFPPISQLLGGSSQPVLDVEPGNPDTRSREDSVVEDYAARFGSEDRTSSEPRSNQNRTHYPKALKDLPYSHPEEANGPGVDAIEEGRGPDLNLLTTYAGPALAPNDPRAYLIRQQRKPSHGKLHRTKSSKLPLESILPGSGTFDLTFTVAIFQDLGGIRSFAKRISFVDTYLEQSQIEHANLNSTDESTKADWAASLRQLLATKYPGRALDGQDPVLDLSTLHFEFLS